jgi:hypothetical protein
MVFSFTGPCVVKGAEFSVPDLPTCCANDGVAEATIATKAREAVADTKASAKLVLVNMVGPPV